MHDGHYESQSLGIMKAGHWGQSFPFSPKCIPQCPIAKTLEFQLATNSSGCAFAPLEFSQANK